jgi:hypothetical protein
MISLNFPHEESNVSFNIELADAVQILQDELDSVRVACG